MERERGADGEEDGILESDIYSVSPRGIMDRRFDAPSARGTRGLV